MSQRSKYHLSVWGGGTGWRSLTALWHQTISPHAFCPWHKLFLPSWDCCHCFLPHGSLLLPFQTSFLLFVTPTPVLNSYHHFFTFWVFIRSLWLWDALWMPSGDYYFNHHSVITIPIRCDPGTHQAASCTNSTTAAFAPEDLESKNNIGDWKRIKSDGWGRGNNETVLVSRTDSHLIIIFLCH